MIERYSSQLSEMSANEQRKYAAQIMVEFKQLPVYKLLDANFTTSLSALLSQADERRIALGKNPLAIAPVGYEQFYELHKEMFPEIILIEREKIGSGNNNYRIPNPLIPGFIERIVLIEPLVDLPKKTDAWTKGSVSLRELIKEANIGRINNGLEPIPKRNKTYRQFLDSLENEMPEVTLVSYGKYGRRPRVSKKNRPAVEEKLLTLDISRFRFERNEPEREQYYITRLEPVLIELSGADEPDTDKIYSSVNTVVYSFLSSYLGMSRDFDDIAAMAMQKLIPYINGYRGEFSTVDDLRGFIFTVCKSCTIDNYRTSTTTRRVDEYNDDKLYDRQPVQDDPEEIESAIDIKFRVSMAQLTAEQRRVLELSIKGCTNREIARIFSEEEGQFIFENAIKSRLFRARRSLERLMEDKSEF